MLPMRPAGSRFLRKTGSGGNGISEHCNALSKAGRPPIDPKKGNGRGKISFSVRERWYISSKNSGCGSNGWRQSKSADAEEFASFAIKLTCSLLGGEGDGVGPGEALIEGVRLSFSQRLVDILWLDRLSSLCWRAVISLDSGCFSQSDLCSPCLVWLVERSLCIDWVSAVELQLGVRERLRPMLKSSGSSAAPVLLVALQFSSSNGSAGGGVLTISIDFWK